MPNGSHSWASETRHLLEQLQPLPHHGELDEGEAGDVATWTRQACDEALTERIVDHSDDNRDGAGRLFQRGNNRRAMSNDQVRRRLHQLRRVSLDTGGAAAGKSIVDPDIAALPPSKRRKLLPKGRGASLCLRVAFCEAL
jgi:hypothetical protein